MSCSSTPRAARRPRGRRADPTSPPTNRDLSPGHGSSAHLEPLDALERVARRLDEALDDDDSLSSDPVDHPAPLLAGVAFRADDIELHLKPVRGHPVEDLLCFQAPAAWSCLGVVAGGWASTVDETAGRRPRPTDVDRRRVRLVHLVGRSGASINILRQAGSPPVVERRPPTPIVDHGQIDDCCRRALGLPTAPPPPDSRELWAYAWLDRLLQDAVAGRLAGASWPDLIARHPWHTWPVTAAGGSSPDSDVVRAGRSLTERYDWTAVRTLVAEARLSLTVSPRVASWMDEGMFARTALSAYPDLVDTLGDLEALLEPTPYRRVVDTLSSWGMGTGVRGKSMKHNENG